ncbi:MAG: D-alanine--D-alanine ligase [Latescibacteria bacterium DG_63]|nr:MAG: D-alanine--D-alanine ligase [Latescibacteria bacterium DG_63]
MKIAVIYNYESKAVINLFGVPNRERYGLETIKAITSALKQRGHQVRRFEGDKNIIAKLEDFMPGVIAGERPGLVFNLSYGIQGKARYTHIPGILEMIGVPYLGSSPDTHAIALDKVVTKMILRQRGLPTPNFDVLEEPDSPVSENLRYPLIVKPRSEAVSFGLKIVHDEQELREGVAKIHEAFRQPALVEEYIDGREINVALLGNDPPEPLPAVELDFGDGEPIFTYEDKTHRNGREIKKICPAPLDEEQTHAINSLAVKAFRALGCLDCARVDLRMDRQGNFYILEVNSMASLGRGGSYVYSASKIGLDYADLVNRLVDVATQRYFGTVIAERVEEIKPSTEHSVFSHLTGRRDVLEKDIEEWTNLASRTDDAVRVGEAVNTLEGRLAKLGLVPVPDLTNQRSAWTWQTPAGLASGTLVVLTLDSPVELGRYPVPFRREPEWLHGEAIATSRAGIACTLAAFSALRSVRRLRKSRIGVFAYTDEGRGMRYSSELLRRASEKAAQVLVMRPGARDGKVITQRRGFRKYSLAIEGNPVRIGSQKGGTDVLTWLLNRAASIAALSRPSKGLTVSVQDVSTERYGALMPHRVRATVGMAYLDPHTAESADSELREVVTPGSRVLQVRIEVLEDRPAFRRSAGNPIVAALKSISEEWKLPFGTDSSLVPSAAGLVTSKIPVVCGLAPAGRDIFTPREAVHRGELLQRTLLLALLLSNLEAGPR